MLTLVFSKGHTPNEKTARMEDSTSIWRKAYEAFKCGVNTFDAFDVWGRILVVPAFLISQIFVMNQMFSVD